MRLNASVDDCKDFGWVEKHQLVLILCKAQGSHEVSNERFSYGTPVVRIPDGSLHPLDVLVIRKQTRCLWQ